MRRLEAGEVTRRIKRVQCSLPHLSQPLCEDDYWVDTPDLSKKRGPSAPRAMSETPGLKGASLLLTKPAIASTSRAVSVVSRMLYGQGKKRAQEDNPKMESPTIRTRKQAPNNVATTATPSRRASEQRTGQSYLGGSRSFTYFVCVPLAMMGPACPSTTLEMTMRVNAIDPPTFSAVPSISTSSPSRADDR